MNDLINSRLIELRKACGKSQEEFGKALGITKSGVSDIENGRRNVTEQHIIMLRNWSEFNISEEWLRTGTGDMFRVPTEDEEMGRALAELIGFQDDNPLYEMIFDIMKTYLDLDPKSQEVIRNSCHQLAENIRNKKK